MDQSVLDRAVKIATKAALSGSPVQIADWIENDRILSAAMQEEEKQRAITA